MKEPARDRRGQVVAHRVGAGALAKDRDVRGVATEGGDVLLHPAQRSDLVEEGVVAAEVEWRLGAERRMRQEAEGAEAIIERDQHDAGACESGAVVDRRPAGSVGQRSTVNPDHHRAAVTRRGGRRPDVEGQAVFTRRLEGAAVRSGHRIGLRADRTELGSIARDRPTRDRLRWTPAQLADRRRGEGNAAKDADTVGLAAGERSVGNGDGGRHGRGWSGCLSRRRSRGGLLCGGLLCGGLLCGE